MSYIDNRCREIDGDYHRPPVVVRVVDRLGMTAGGRGRGLDGFLFFFFGGRTLLLKRNTLAIIYIVIIDIPLPRRFIGCLPPLLLLLLLLCNVHTYVYYTQHSVDNPNKVTNVNMNVWVCGSGHVNERWCLDDMIVGRGGRRPTTTPTTMYICSARDLRHRRGVTYHIIIMILSCHVSIVTIFSCTSVETFHQVKLL